MTESIDRLLCISSYEKGQDFMRQCAEMGVRTTLLTVDKLRDADWPRDALEQVTTMPDGLTCDQLLNTVSWMARGRRFDRVVALDEFDQETAALIREHMRLPGMGVTTTAFYRDKLAMRTAARETGFPVPDFCRVFNYDELRAYMDSVPGPWLLKPRPRLRRRDSQINEPEQLWRALDELGDRQSHFVLERFVPGDIFHVDSVVSEGKVVFAAVHKYGRPPMQVVMRAGFSQPARWIATARSGRADGIECTTGPGSGAGPGSDPCRIHSRECRWQVLLPGNCSAGGRERSSSTWCRPLRD